MDGEQLDSDELKRRNPQAGPAPSATGSAGAAGPLGQQEVEALLQAAIGGNPDSKTTPAQAARADAASHAASAESDLGMASGDVEYLLQQAELALASVNEPVQPSADLPVKPFRLQDYSGAPRRAKPPRWP